MGDEPKSHIRKFLTEPGGRAITCARDVVRRKERGKGEKRGEEK